MSSVAGAGRATAVYVAYRTPAIDMAWIPPGADVIVVHNDGSEPALERELSEILAKLER